MAKNTIIGLDIGTTAVRAAQLTFGAGGPQPGATPTVTAVHEVRLPLGAVRDGEVADQPTVVAALRELWQKGRFESREVVLGVGNPRVLVRELELPWIAPSQRKSSLHLHVQEMLPMPADEALLDYWATGESDGPAGRVNHGLLVAAPKDTVNINVLAAEAAGLVPVMVDLNAFALIRALARGDLAQRVVAFVDIGARLTNVTIAAQGQPRLVRILRTGGHDVTEAVAGAMSVPVPEAEVAKRQIGVGFAVPPEHQAVAEAVLGVVQTLVESVRNTLTYYASNNHGAAAEVIVLTGGGVHLPGLGQYLSSASRLPVTLGDPLAGLRHGKGVGGQELQGNESLLAVPVGLAYGVAA